jgi:hypothetical protein
MCYPYPEEWKWQKELQRPCFDGGTGQECECVEGTNQQNECLILRFEERSWLACTSGGLYPYLSDYRRSFAGDPDVEEQRCRANSAEAQMKDAAGLLRRVVVVDGRFRQLRPRDDRVAVQQEVYRLLGIGEDVFKFLKEIGEG